MKTSSENVTITEGVRLPEQHMALYRNTHCTTAKQIQGNRLGPRVGDGNQPSTKVAPSVT